MTRRVLVLLILSIVVVLVAGGLYGFVQIDRSNVGIPRFYVWRSLSGEFHGSHRANVNGISLYYETYGHGPPVLVLHGAGAFLETMHYFITALSPAHTVIAVDSRASVSTGRCEPCCSIAPIGIATTAPASRASVISSRVKFCQRLSRSVISYPLHFERYRSSTSLLVLLPEQQIIIILLASRSRLESTESR